MFSILREMISLVLKALDNTGTIFFLDFDPVKSSVWVGLTYSHCVGGDVCRARAFRPIPILVHACRVPLTTLLKKGV